MSRVCEGRGVGREVCEERVYNTDLYMWLLREQAPCDPGPFTESSECHIAVSLHVPQSTG